MRRPEWALRDGGFCVRDQGVIGRGPSPIAPVSLGGRAAGVPPSTCLVSAIRAG